VRGRPFPTYLHRALRGVVHGEGSGERGGIRSISSGGSGSGRSRSRHPCPSGEGALRNCKPLPARSPRRFEAELRLSLEATGLTTPPGVGAELASARGEG
jgi:hypothetical protein